MNYSYRFRKPLTTYKIQPQADTPAFREWQSTAIIQMRCPLLERRNAR